MVEGPNSRQGMPAASDRGAVRGSLLALGAALLLGAGLRLWMITHAEVIARDGIGYVATARALSIAPADAMRTSRVHPGYPGALAAMRGLAVWLGAPEETAWDQAGQIVSLAAGLAATVAIWAFAAMAFNWRIAWMTALLTSVARKWAALGADVLGDALAVCWQLWAVVAAMAALRLLPRNRSSALLPAALTGLCAGAGYLVRPEAMVVLVLAVAMWLAFPLRGAGWRRRLAAAVAAITVAACVAAPYVAVTGRLTNKTDLFEAVRLPAGSGVAGCLATIDPAGWAGQVFSALHRAMDLFFEAQQPVLGSLTLICLGAYLARRWPRLEALRRVLPVPAADGTFLMVGLTVAFMSLSMANYLRLGAMSYRYLMPCALLLSPLAVATVLGAAALIRPLLSKLRRGALLSKALSQLLVALIAAGLLLHSLRPPHEGKGGYRQAGEFLRSVAGAGDFVLTDEGWVLHYSGLKGLVCHRPFTRRLLASLLRAKRATYLAIGDSAVDDSDPSLLNLGSQTGFVKLGQFASKTSGHRETVRVYCVEAAVPASQSAPSR
jgi:hypothetical protein